MKIDNLSRMTKGWFIGDFNPTVYKTNDVEVATKYYKAGEYEESHYHKISTEITVIVSGTVRMNDIEYVAGDIIVMEPNDATDFCAITDAVNVVVKLPRANNDKYILNM